MNKMSRPCYQLIHRLRQRGGVNNDDDTDSGKADGVFASGIAFKEGNDGFVVGSYGGGGSAIGAFQTSP